MRIAHVTDFYLPRLGGIEMHVSDLAERQRLRGHDVHVVTSSPAGAVPPDPTGAVRVHRVTDGFRRPHALHPFAVRDGITDLLALRPDVVHAHLGVASPLAFFLARAAARHGIPTVVTVHSMWAGVRPIMKTMDALGGWSDLPITWTAVSRAAAAPVAAILPATTTIHVLANGIDQDEWRLPAAPPPGPGGEVVLAAVMRLARRKRPLALLRLVRDAQLELDRLGDPTRLRLVVAGDGPRRAAMQSWVHRHGMADAVELLGRVDRATVHDVLGRSHAFLAPADLESFGIAALEARCAGLPVVAKSHGGVREFVHDGREGLLCDSDADMAAAIVRLVREPGLRARLAEHNRVETCAVAWGPLLDATHAAYGMAQQQLHHHRAPARARVPAVP